MELTVLWNGTRANGQPNRFAAKHLHVVGAHFDIGQMKAEGFRILSERNSFVVIANKNAIYGKIQPAANTLVITNQGGLQAMEAWIQLNATVSDSYSIPVGVGVIVQNHYETMMGMNIFSEVAKVGGSINVDIDVVGLNKYVYHMTGIDDAGDEFKDYKMNTGGVSFTV